MYKGEIKMLDLEMLKIIPAGTVFGEGIVIDNPDGINMTNSGKDLRWVAKKGFGYDDWAIYIHWADNDILFVAEQGDKVNWEDNIRKLVPCTDEVYEKYRF